MSLGSAYADAIEPDATCGQCDIDLPTGRGLIRTATGERAVEGVPAPPRLRDWERRAGWSRLAECS